MGEIIVKIVAEDGSQMPEYKSPGSAGADIRACIQSPIRLAPGQRIAVPTGLRIELPVGYEAQVRPRSGLALEKGITCLNSPGTIDSDYRGEIKVILINLGGSDAVIEPGDRIAQLVVSSVERAVFSPVEELAPSDRGHGGFGSTGR